MDTEKAVERPEIVEDEHLEFLDVLRDTGVTNMFGAAPYLRREFRGLKEKESHEILKYWMHTFSQRHPR